MALAEAEPLKMEKVKRTRKGSKIYTYWMACWREGDKTRNVHLGSAGKMDAEAARRKAREMKRRRWGAGVTSEFGQWTIFNKIANFFARYIKCPNKEE